MDYMIKTIMIAPIVILMVGAITASIATRAYSDEGSDAGDQAARADFSSGAGYHATCADHGYDVTQDPGFCLSFKAAYILQWGILELGR